MPRHRGFWWQQWGKCQRCWRTNPVGYLTMQTGLLLCRRCIDNLDVEYRPKVIADILSDSQEAENEYADLGTDSEEIVF